MPAPLNISAVLATVISALPFSTTQNVHDSGTTYTVWYTYTPASSGVYGVWAFGDLTTYTPQVKLYTGPASAPVLVTTHSQNKPFQVYLTGGTEYFFEIVTNGGNPSPASLAFSVLAAPSQLAPVGSLIINDDTDGFPAAVLSSTTGAVIAYKQPFPAGEGGAALTNGRTIFSDEFGDTLQIFDPSLGLLTTIPTPEGRFALTSDRDQYFYAGADNGVIRIDQNGTIGPTTWALGSTGLWSMAVSLDNTILYYVESGSNKPIKRWDLSNNVALSNLAAGIASHQATQDMLVLEDGSIVVGYNGSTFIGKRYDASGSVLNSYTFDASFASSTNRLAIAPDSPTSFWIWSHQVSGGNSLNTSLFKRIKTSDGTTVTSFSAVTYELGTYTGNATATPEARFGHSFSCPLVVLLGTEVPPEDPDEEENPGEPPTSTPPEDCPCPPPDGPSPSSGGSNPYHPPTGTGPFGGGGSGKSGTNEGGEGWTLSCAGGGTVSTYATASAGESMVGCREPRIWTEIAFDGGTAYWSQDVTLPDATRKDGRVLSFGKISRSISDDNGNYTGSKVTVSLNDKDRASLRTRLGASATKYVWDREGVIKLASETNRRTGYATTPRELFRGMSKDVALAAKFNGQITFEDRVCSQFGQFGPDRSFSSRLLTLGLFPGCPREIVGKPQQWIFGEVSDEGATHPSTGESSSKGLVPIWLVGTVGSEDEYHLCGHAITNLTNLYGSDGLTPPSRVALDPGSYRYEYKTVTDTETGLTHGVTSIYLPSDSVPSQAHKSGQLNMAANVCGIKGANGSLLTDLFKQYQWIFEHLILPEQESLTGAYVGSPQWADGRYMVHSSSFAQAQTYSIARIGGSGYQGAFVLGGPGQGAVTLRDLLKRMSNSGDCWFTWSHGGQVKCVVLDDSTALVGATTYTEPADLREMPTPSFAYDEVENPVLYAYDWDDDKQKFRVAQKEEQDDLAAERMGRPRPSPSPIQMRCVRDEATAQDVAQRRLMRRKYPPAYYPVVLPIDGVDKEPGDYIQITSQEGVGTGSTLRPLFVKEWSFDPKTWRTTLRCQDLTDILGIVAHAGPNSGSTTWDASSTGDRALYLYAASEDGTVPSSGAPAMELR
jgi:hypothetical protein